MKKLFFIVIFVISFVIIFSEVIFAEEIDLGTGSYFIYVHANGAWDWDTFYAKWDDVPNSYFIYLNYFTHSDFPEESLVKIVGGLEALFDKTGARNNDIKFVVERRYSSLEIIFSPWNYTNASNNGWIPIGQKRYNYRDAKERWNYMLQNMQR